MVSCQREALPRHAAPGDGGGAALEQLFMAALASLGPGTNTFGHSSPDLCLIPVVCATQPGWKGSLLPPRSCVRPERATNPSELSVAGERNGTEGEEEF